VTTLSGLHFEWDLRALSAEETNVPPPFMLCGAEKGERDAVETVVSNAFTWKPAGATSKECLARLR
jgi:hypothetical protein